MAEPQSRLAAARFIVDISRVAYPEHVKIPRRELNANAPARKFKYDRDFLLQFMDVCKDKPNNLPPLETFALGTLSPNLASARGQRKNDLPALANKRVPYEPVSRATSLADKNETRRGVTPIERRTDEPKRTRSKRGKKHIEEKEEEARAFNTHNPAGRRVETMATVEVQSLLNTLTSDDFDFTSDLIIIWVNSSEGEGDGGTLFEVARLVFEKATEEAASCELCTRLCSKIMEQVSPRLVENRASNVEEPAVTADHPFCKHLLSHCWEGIEKAKRQGPGLVRFIDELFRAQLLMEHLMHEWIKKLLSNIDVPGKENIESLCALLETVGHSLDTTQARSDMNNYFNRMKDLSDSNNIEHHLRSMLLDVIELRSRNWIPRDTLPAPRTIVSMHDQAAKEREKARRMNVTSREASGDDDRRREYGHDGWAVPADRTPSFKAGDLSQFDKITKTVPSPASLSLSSVFAGQADVEKRGLHSLSRATRPSSNPFATLTQDLGFRAANAPSATQNSIPRVDLSNAGSNAGDHSRKLQLTSRIKPDEWLQANKMQQIQRMNDAEVKKRVDGDTKEFFALRNLNEAELYFESLPYDQRYKMVDSVFTKALEGKDAEATLVGGLLAKAIDGGKITSEDIEKGVAGTMEFLDDIAVDAPAAYALVAKMLFMAKLSEEAVTRLGEEIYVDGDPLVAPKERLLKEFKKLSS